MITACFKSNGSDSKFYGEGGENVAASLDEVADAINTDTSGDFGIQSQINSQIITAGSFGTQIPLVL
jgi:hypothetical protein